MQRGGHVSSMPDVQGVLVYLLYRGLAEWEGE